MPHSLLVYDTETTGVNPESGDEIIQFACLFVDQYGTSLQFEGLCNPEVPIPKEAFDKHSISNEMLVGKPHPKELIPAIFGEIMDQAKGTTLILIGHNTQFDKRFVEKYVQLPPDVLSICTLRIARVMLPFAKNHQLEYLYREHYKLASDKTMKAHDALCDVFMCWELLGKLLDPKVMDNLEELAREMALPLELFTMPFGKNQGDSFEHLPPKYLRWLVAQGSQMDMDVRYSAGKQLKLWQNQQEMMASI